MVDFPIRIAADGSVRILADGGTRIIDLTVQPIPVLSSDTLLSISSFGVLLYQARGLTQTLEPIIGAHYQDRAVNGTLLNLANPAFQKYKTKISCTDVDAPPFDKVWPGMAVTVDCAIYLAYENGNPGSPSRPEVSGSSFTEGDYTFYRPVLAMQVCEPKEGFAEWDASVQWEIDLEEV